MQRVHQTGEIRGRAVAAPPFLRQSFCKPPKLGAVHLLGAAKDRLERVPSGDMLIDRIAGINSSKRRVGEIPLGAVKAIALVDEARAVLPRRSWFGEHHLAAIGVPGPLVEHEHARLW